MREPRPLVQRIAGALSPTDACARFADLPYLLLLDSAGGADHLARYSFLTADPAVVVRGRGNRTERCWLGEQRIEQATGDALSVVRELLAPFRTEPVAGIPPFQGGAAGYIGYDYGAALESVPAPAFDDLVLPDVVLGVYDWVLAWDHRAATTWLVSTGFPAALGSRDARGGERAAFVLRRLETPVRPPSHAPSVPAQPPDAPRAPRYPLTPHDATADAVHSTFSRDAYLVAVRRVREYILAGDVFQVNLTQRFDAPLPVGDTAWSLYERLRARTPSPFASYFDFGDAIIASASPERFLRVAPDGDVETRPIKGTRPRGATAEADARLGEELLASAKDRAENVMIVDLLRNDLSRVCAPGSVSVPQLCVLERYATVQHLVSTVTGHLRDGCDNIDLLRAAFPGGSITGAPKVRAMQIIAELESSRRGPYCGSVGYLSVTGAMDMNIVIRTFVIVHGHAYFAAGGGIVADSDPDAEYRETLDKARALIAALQTSAVPA